MYLYLGHLPPYGPFLWRAALHYHGSMSQVPARVHSEGLPVSDQMQTANAHPFNLHTSKKEVSKCTVLLFLDFHYNLRQESYFPHDTLITKPNVTFCNTGVEAHL